MKKSLTLLLAMAMVFSMFATVAFADTSTTTSTDIQAKVQALESAGILNGFPDGSMHLNDDMTRAQFAKVAALILGLDVPATVTVPSYTDTGSSWASGYIEAATKAGLLNGVGMGKFNPDGDVTIEQMAKVLDLGLKLDTSSSVAVSGTVSDWAKAYVAAAVGAGLIPPSTDYTSNATRSALVSAGYAAYQEVKGNGVSVTSSTAVDANTVSVTFSDGVTKQFTLTTPLQLGVAANVPVTYNGVSYTVTVTLQQLSIVKAAATAADTVTVTFNQAVADTANAKATLNELGTAVSTTASWSDDKTQLILKASSSLLTGQYTVTIDGLNIPDGQNTASFMVTAAQVSKITINDTAYITAMYDVGTKVTTIKALAKTEDISVGYKLFDQYGNDVTSTYANLNVSVSAGEGAVDYSSPGTINITNADPSFDSMIVSLVDTDNGVNAVQNVTIKGEKTLDSITLSAPQPHDGDTSIKSGGTPYVVPVVAKDQFGNDYSFGDNKSYDDLKDTVTFIPSDPSVLSRDQIGTDADGNVVIKSFGTFDGTRTIMLTAIVNGTGKQSTTTFTVNGTATAAVPMVVAPTSRMSIDNDSTHPFKVQLNVNDIFGNAMSASDIISAYNNDLFVSVSGQAAKASPAVVSDGTNAYIQVYATGTGNGTITVNTNQGKFAHITLQITDKKVVSSLALVTDVTGAVYDTNAATSGHIKLTATFKDQYGDAVTSDNVTADEGAQVVDLYTDTTNVFKEVQDGSSGVQDITLPSSDDTTIHVTVSDLLSGNLRIAPAAGSKLTTTSLTGKLWYTPNDTSTPVSTTSNVALTTVVDASTLTYVADPASVTLATAGQGTMAAKSPVFSGDYAVTLGVDGKDASGNLIAIPASSVTDPSVSSSEVAVDPSTNKIVAYSDATDGDKVIAVVTVSGPGMSVPQVVQIPVTISTAAPAAQSLVAANSDGDTITSLSLDPTSNIDFTDSGSVLNFIAKDQYGQSDLSKNITVYVDGNKIADATDSGSSLATAGKHTITAIIGSLSTSITVYVNSAP